MAKDSVAGEFGEGDFGDQLRLHPVSALAVSARHLDGRLVDLERPHPLHEVIDQLSAEAGPHFSDISELTLVLGRKEERAEAEALIALRPADDDELLALDALDLQPIARARAPVWRIRLLGDDALTARLAHGGEQLVAAADDVIAIEHRRRHAFKECREALLAFDIGQFTNVLTAVDQEIEGVENQVGALSVLESRLEQVEAGLAGVIDRDCLAVDQAAGREPHRSL